MDRQGGPAPFTVSPWPTTTVGGLEVIDLRASLPMEGAYPERTLLAVKYLVVHHSGVITDSSAWSIANYHIHTQGWPGIGYHFLVHQDGTIEYVGDIHQMRNNVARRNHEVIGACLPGNWSLSEPADAQVDATAILMAALRREVGRPLPIVGHGEIAVPGWETECPGDTYQNWRHRLEP